jgi:hypothetical protein
VEGFRLGKSVGEGPGDELTFRLASGQSRVAELAGGVEELGVAGALWSAALEVIEGAAGKAPGVVVGIGLVVWHGVQAALPRCSERKEE